MLSRFKLKKGPIAQNNFPLGKHWLVYNEYLFWYHGFSCWRQFYLVVGEIWSQDSKYNICYLYIVSFWSSTINFLTLHSLPFLFFSFLLVWFYNFWYQTTSGGKYGTLVPKKKPLISKVSQCWKN